MVGYGSNPPILEGDHVTKNIRTEEMRNVGFCNRNVKLYLKCQLMKTTGVIMDKLPSICLHSVTVI